MYVTLTAEKGETRTVGCVPQAEEIAAGPGLTEFVMLTVSAAWTRTALQTHALQPEPVGMVLHVMTVLFAEVVIAI